MLEVFKFGDKILYNSRQSNTFARIFVHDILSGTETALFLVSLYSAGLTYIMSI